MIDLEECLYDNKMKYQCYEKILDVIKSIKTYLERCGCCFKNDEIFYCKCGVPFTNQTQLIEHQTICAVIIKEQDFSLFHIMKENPVILEPIEQDVLKEKPTEEKSKKDGDHEYCMEIDGYVNLFKSESWENIKKCL